MRRLDARSSRLAPDEVAVFSVARNEALRLPAWLQHYRRLGAHRFFVVDNASSDGTQELLLGEPDVHVFQTDQSFHEARYGSLWLQPLMAEYGTGRWCVVADADEWLAPPHWEFTRLSEVGQALEADESEALPCLLLDMYSDRSLRETVLDPGVDLLRLCPFFDPDFEPKDATFLEGEVRHPIPTWVGSTRRKVFGITPYLSKIGMLRYHPSMVLTSGQHALLGGRISQVRGVMFHFKFLSDFVEKAEVELERDERRTHTHEWVAYAEALRKDPDLSLYDHRSVRLEDCSQLLELGLMKTTPAYDAVIAPETAR